MECLDSDYSLKRYMKNIVVVFLNIIIITCTYISLRIQICPKKGTSPTILFWGWDLDHQS